MRRTFALLLLTTSCVAMVARRGGAGDNVDVHGYVLGHFAHLVPALEPCSVEASEFLVSEGRFRLDVNAWWESIEAEVRIRGDLVADSASDSFNVDLREAYFDYATGDFDFRVGRQVATWGVGDLLFINDVFPKDWVSFFVGRPMEYLKLGVEGVRTRYSSRPVNAELIVLTNFTPDDIPTAPIFCVYDPYAEVALRDEQRPASTYENAELALRLYRRVGNFDASAYFYRGFWRSPSFSPDSLPSPASLTTFYPRLSIYGVSAQGRALSGVLSLETGYYDSRDDHDGNDPSVPNSEWRFLVGYQKQLWKDANVGVQYYGEVMEGYSDYLTTLPPSVPPQAEYRDMVTLRFEQLLHHQQWRLSIFAFIGLTDEDYLIRPLVTHRLSDDLLLALGANLFGGEKDATFLGQLDGNDNLYLSVRFDF
jgi:hypothetical protein